MMNRYRPYVLMLVLASLMAVMPHSTLLAQGDTVEILAPVNNAILSGVVVIKGSVDIPNTERYEFYLGSGGQMPWVATNYTPVNNGNLARLDTRLYANGIYQLVIRLVKTDGNYEDSFGPTITFDNGSNDKQPYYADVEPNYLYTTANRALLRIRNCTGETFQMDYTSPADFRSAGEVNLPAQMDGFLCPFEDVSLIPAEYRGTAKGSTHLEDLHFDFIASGGNVYEMRYNGPSAGRHALVISVIAGDLPNDTSEVTFSTAATATPTPPTAISQPAPASILPVSGQDLRADYSSVLPLLGGLMVLILLGAGLSAFRRRA